MKILLTGPNGYLAKALRKNTELDFIYEKDSYGNIIETEITKPERFYDMEYDIILHNAGIVGTTNCDVSPYTVDVNVNGTANIVDLALKKNVPLIYLSTTVIYEPTNKIIEENSKINPQTLYGKTKYLGEIIVKTLMKNYIIIRPCMIFGVNDKHSAITMAMTSTEKNKKTIYLNPGYRKPYLHVDEFIRGMEIIIKNYKNLLGLDFNFAPKEHHQVKHILNYIDNLMKTNYNLIGAKDYLKDHILSGMKIATYTGWKQKISLWDSIDKVYSQSLKDKNE